LPSPSPRHRASRRLPFAGVTPLLAPQKPRVLMHRDEAHAARSESPGAAPGLCCREKTCAPLSSSSAANSFSRASRIAGTLPSVPPAMPKHFGSEP
jgi:hypothetical protein